MKKRALLLAAVLVGLWELEAGASLTATLSQAVENSASGQTLVYCGTLVNTSLTSEIFLNNIEFSLSGSASGCMVSGTNAFYANVPGILAPGQSYTGEVFSVALSGTAPAADYTGTITLEGGGDIFSTGDLVTDSFTVLSPAVTLVATGTNAAEDGPVPGIFTITRTGGTEIALPVAFSIGGTAVNGTDYEALATSGTIASGSSTATIVVTPIPNDTAQANPTVTVSLLQSSQYDLGLATSGTIAIQVKPVDAWRYAEFGALANTPAAADTADWSGGGIRNLVAFALNIDPWNPKSALLPSGSLLSNYLTLTYTPNAAATDVSYTVEASTDMTDWSPVNVVPTSNPASAPAGSLSFRYMDPIGGTGRVFLRLSITRTDE